MKLVVVIPRILLVVGSTAYSQNSYGFGLIGGLNYNANGNYYESVDSNAQHPDRNIGFHVGGFGKIGSRLYFKPGLIFTSTKSDYTDGSFKMQKLDAPLLVGIKLIGPLSIFAGPSFQYILDSDFGSQSIDNFENEISMGLNFGIGLSISKIGIDLKYERGFSSNEANFINNNDLNVSKIDSRPDQLILSLSLLL